MTERKLPKYKNPPLNEVALGITFAPLKKMKAAYIGLFWNNVKKEFPKCEQAQVIGDNINEIIEEETGMPNPRIWLISKDDDLLIQIQKNKFLLNWRKKDKSYPHYEDVSERFFKYLKEFSDFLIKNDLGPIEYTEFELSYFNHIPRGDGWDDWKSIGNLFPDLAWKNENHRFLSNPEGIIWQPVFKLPDNNGQLLVKIQPVTRLMDGIPVIIFEITANSKNSNKADKDIHEWFNRSHEFITKSFEDLTSHEVQDTVWGKIKDVK